MITVTVWVLVLLQANQPPHAMLVQYPTKAACEHFAAAGGNHRLLRNVTQV